MRRRTLVQLALLVTAVLAVPAMPAVAATPTLSGTVTMSGTPRSGVHVGWYSPGGTVVTTTTTTADGTFSLPSPPSGTTYFLTANVAATLTHPHPAVRGWLATYVGADGVPKLAAPLVTGAVSDGADRVVSVTVPKAVQVSGRNAAFAGRTVSLLTAGRVATAATKATGTGSWSFLVAPGRYRIGVDGNLAWLDYRSRTFTVGSRAVVKRSSPTRTATLQGRLTVGGRPAAKVPVRWDGPYQGDEAPEALAHTDANGRYRLRGLVPGHFIVTYGNAGDQNDRSTFLRRTRTRDLAPGTTTTVDVAMTHGATISAGVQTGQGSRTWSTLLTRNGTLVRTTAFVTHSSATKNPLRLRGLPSGTYVLQLTDGVHTLSRTVRATAGRTRDLGTLRPGTTPLTISGAGPAGASVTASQASLSVSARVGSDGSYRLPGLLPGRYSVTTAGAGHRPATVRVTIAADTTLDVALGAAESSEFRRVTGTVLAGGVPIPIGQLVLANGPTLSVRDGAIVDAVLRPNTYLAARFEILGANVFPSGTPYGVAWLGPDIHVVSGADTDLGTVQLGVVG